MPGACDRVGAVETAYDRDGKYLGRLADVFGDPTRRGIYRHLRDASEPLSASEVADVFGVHRTVARAHLEKLAELALVEYGTRRRSGGGRPAKTYELAAERLEVMLPPRRYERLSRLLLRLVDRTVEPGLAADAAFDLGRAFGAETASEIAGDDVQPPVKLAPHAVVAWMDAAGYSVTLDDGAKGVVVVEVRNCVYRELAEEFPDIVCPFDRGTVCGMLGVEPSAHTQTHSMSAGDDHCRHEFRL
jgi:predicted ArsR family transcriptional regulator